MKALQTMLNLAKGYGYGSLKSVSDKYNFNWRTVKLAHNFLKDNKLIQFDDTLKIWVFAPVGYIYKSRRVAEELELNRSIHNPSKKLKRAVAKAKEI